MGLFNHKASIVCARVVSGVGGVSKEDKMQTSMEARYARRGASGGRRSYCSPCGEVHLLNAFDARAVLQSFLSASFLIACLSCLSRIIA